MEEGTKVKAYATERLTELKDFINDNDIKKEDILMCQYAKTQYVLLYYYTVK